MDWDRLQLFHSVVLAGNFTKAADQMQLSQSSISRQMSALEDELEIALFNRQSRGFILTDQGEYLFGQVAEMITDLSITEAILHDSVGSPKGVLKINTTISVASFVISQFLKDFYKQYPQVRLHLTGYDHDPEIDIKGAHLYMLGMPSTNPTMISEALPPFTFYAYAHSSYLEANGIPQTPADLDKHQLLVYNNELAGRVPMANVLCEIGTSRGRIRLPYLLTNSYHGMLLAVESGLGIACLHPLIIQSGAEQKNIKQVLHGYDMGSYHCYLIYPEQLRNSPRIQAFRKFIFDLLNRTNQ